MSGFVSLIKKLFKRRNTEIEVTSEEIGIKIDALEKVLNFEISSKSFYIKALTHRSYLEIYPDLEKSNERLEFLGDSVLNMVVAKYLFEKYKEEGEGYLTKARANLVNRDNLFKAAESLGLINFILFNRKYLKDSKEGFKTILADAFEALVGAIFLDKGIGQAETFINKWIINPARSNQEFLIDTNFKGQLLEYTHANKLEVPRYVLQKEEGPEHNKEFTIEVHIGDRLMGVGKGFNKKSAEQEASKIALENLSQNEINIV